MMNRSELLGWFSDVVPFEIRRKRPNSWIAPASVGVGLGILAGIGIGVLVAPRPGKETRRQLRDGASRLKERARLAADDAQARVRDALQSGEHDYVEEQRSFLDEGRT